MQQRSCAELSGKLSKRLDSENENVPWLKLLIDQSLFVPGFLYHNTCMQKCDLQHLRLVPKILGHHQFGYEKKFETYLD